MMLMLPLDEESSVTDPSMAVLIHVMVGRGKPLALHTTLMASGANAESLIGSSRMVAGTEEDDRVLLAVFKICQYTLNTVWNFLSKIKIP